jgi:hypothetical protein
MGELKTSIVIDLSGNLERMSARYTRTLERFGETGRRHLMSRGRAADDAGRTLDRVGNRYTALVTGAAALGTAKMVMDLEMRMVRLGINAGKGAEEMEALKKQVFAIAAAPDIRLDPGKILTALEAIEEKTGNLDNAQKNLRNIALAIQATGDSGENIGEIVGQLEKMGIVDPSKIMEAIDTLNLQGKEGGMSLANITRLAPRLLSTYAAMGRTGVPAVRELGAALKVIQDGTGDQRKAAAAFESMMQTFMDPEKVKQLKAVAGIDVFDSERLKKGERVLRPINEIMSEIVKKSGGDLTKIAQVFDASAVRGFAAAAEEFKRTGSLDTLEKFMRMQGDGKSTLDDSRRAAQTASAAVDNLFTAWKRFADSNLTGPIQSLANLLNSLSSEKMDTVLQSLKYAGLALGGALVLRKVGGIFTKSGTPGAGGIAGALGGGMPIPVYVVNKHLSLTPDAWTGGGGIAGTAGKLGKVGGVLAGVGRAANLVGLGATVFGASYAAGTAASGYIDSKISQGTGRDATLGTFIYDLLHREKTRARGAAEKQKVDVNVKLEVEGKDATARAKEARAKGGEVDVETGTRVVAGGM